MFSFLQWPILRRTAALRKICVAGPRTRQTTTWTGWGPRDHKGHQPLDPSLTTPNRLVRHSYKLLVVNICVNNCTIMSQKIGGGGGGGGREISANSIKRQKRKFPFSLTYYSCNTLLTISHYPVSSICISLYWSPCQLFTYFLSICFQGAGWYLYIKSSFALSGGNTSPKKARLISPPLSTPGNHCLQLYYHMFGPHVGSLMVYRARNVGLRDRNDFFLSLLFFVLVMLFFLSFVFFFFFLFNFSSSSFSFYPLHFL